MQFPGGFIERRAGPFTDGQRHHQRRETHPFRNTSRHKPRRWPLVLRFIKGSIHGALVTSLVLHGLFAVLVVCLDKYVYDRLGLPGTIIPSLSIVVTLMLVFRNQTSYNRFWDGRNSLTSMMTAIRNITRTILTHACHPDRPLNEEEKQDIERVVRVLIAIPHTVKNHLRAEWGAAWAKQTPTDQVEDPTNGRAVPIYNPEYESLLPKGLQGHEWEGLGLPLQLTYLVDSFINRGVERKWFHAPGASQIQAQLNQLIDAYGKMETISLTPIPVAHLIHQKQVLALFNCVLPFAMVDEMGWWAVPIVMVLTFALYGIEAIGSQLEDPFGYDRNDIKMDAIVEDQRIEMQVVLDEWRRVVRESEAVARRNGNQGGDPGKAPGENNRFTGEMFLRERTNRSSFSDRDGDDNGYGHDSGYQD